MILNLSEASKAALILVLSPALLRDVYLILATLTILTYACLGSDVTFSSAWPAPYPTRISSLLQLSPHLFSPYPVYNNNVSSDPSVFYVLGYYTTKPNAF